MNKQDALSATAKKFTNLIDGKVRPNVGVVSIINYYESLLANTHIQTPNTISNIESNFMEDSIKEIEADLQDNY